MSKYLIPLSRFQSHKLTYSRGEFDELVKAVWASSLFKEAIAELHMPTGFEVVVEPWPYGGNIEDDNPRFFQGLCFAQDTRNKNPDSNFYAYPLPLIPIMDATTREIVRIDKLATGGIDDGFEVGTHDRDILAHCKPAEYVPELLEQGTRKDMKPINVVQPEGASFVVGDDESLVEWQKWRFRVGFNHREGATIHDVWYDGRSVLYRLSISEMVRVVDFFPSRYCTDDFICRLFHMLMHDLHSTANRHSTLEMAAQETVPIISSLDVTVWV